MDFLRLPHPIPKRQTSDVRLRAFPIDRIPESNEERPFIGIYTGLSVEIVDPVVIKLIHSGGSFGLSTKTKHTPQILYEFPRIKNVNQTQYEQKLAWMEKFGNQNADQVMVNLVPQIEANRIEIQCEKTNEANQSDHETNQSESIANDVGEQPLECQPMDENSTNVENVTAVPMQVDYQPESEPELNLVADPFPIEETLALLPEEAFFLHYSLRCLRVMNFEQTHELTTHEMLEKFCNNDEKFIQKFVVYHYYRSKNWVVKSGIKFGGEFCKYKLSLSLNFIVQCFLSLTGFIIPFLQYCIMKDQPTIMPITWCLLATTMTNQITWMCKVIIVCRNQRTKKFYW